VPLTAPTAPTDQTHQMDPAEPTGPDEPTDRNEVRVVGRVSGSPARRSLPSGDELVTFRLVVRREPSGADTFDVAVGPAPPAGVRRRAGQTGRRLLATAAALDEDERVEVAGVLRRRWWGAGATRQSRVEIRAEALHRHRG
jgi:single-strand DNA-binding protein